MTNRQAIAVLKTISENEDLPLFKILLDIASLTDEINEAKGKPMNFNLRNWINEKEDDRRACYRELRNIVEVGKAE